MAGANGLSDELAEEVFAHYSGRRGAERLRAEQERMEGETRSLVGKAKVIAMFERLRDAMRRFWSMARDLFAGKSRGVEKLSAEDFADMALADLLGGVKPERGDRVDRSDRERDAEYMEAVRSGDMEKAQRMVDEAAKRTMPDTKVVDENGNPLVVYHITDNKFTVFHSGNFAKTIYFAFTNKGAKKAARGKKKALEVFLNAKNPVNTKDNPIPWYEAEDNIKVAKWREEGYDGVYVSDESGVSIAVFSPEQIKSADPVTYDDSGNVIPLSKRFNRRKEDIRYERVGKRERTAAEREINNLTDEEVGVMRHKAFAMQSEYMAKNGTMPLEMGLFTANHFVIVNNVELGNISAVRAFDIEKDPDRIAEEINQLIDNEGDEISSGISALIEEARTRLPNGFHYTSNIGKRGVGVRNAGVGERQQSDRGADNALDSGAHVEGDSDVRFRGEERLRDGGETVASGAWADRGSVERIGEFAGYTPEQVERMSARQEESARNRFRETAEKLHLGDRIEFVESIDEVEGLTDKQREARRKKKGWYDPKRKIICYTVIIRL